jgi:transmembrane sensor
MSNRESAEKAASAWIARRELSGWGAADQRELEVWIAQSMDHRVAWLRLSTAWEETRRLKSLSSSAAPGEVPAPEEIHSPFLTRAEGTAQAATSTHRRFFASYRALAAGFALVIAGLLAWHVLPDGSGYHTEVGALQAVPLVDGSRVTLNTNTDLRVNVTPTVRMVHLEQGEAFFEVAKDAKRPFIVEAGDKRIIAVGTAFSVRRDRADVRVLVTEGAVRVESQAGAGTPAGQLGAGAVAHAGSDGLLVQERPVAEVEQLLSWRTGYLAFDKTRLADAAAEFNRYNRTRLIIEDPATAAIEVGGSFRATNVEGFVRLIESDFPIVARQQGNDIVLSGKAAQ